MLRSALVAGIVAVVIGMVAALVSFFCLPGSGLGSGSCGAILFSERFFLEHLCL